MKKKDWVKRINRQIGGDKTWMLIERRKCTNPSCRKTHRLLPDISIPYKHYDAGVIEDVIDGHMARYVADHEMMQADVINL